MSNVIRTLIPQSSVVADCRILSSTLAGAGGTGMYERALMDATGEKVAYISAGFISSEFDSLLPQTRVDAEGNVTHTAGNPAAVAYLASEAGLAYTQADIETIFAAIDVSDQSAEEAMSRLNLNYYTPTIKEK